MFHYPPMKNRRKSTEMIQNWGGLNYDLRAAENEFSRMEGMCTEHYPVAGSSRPEVSYMAMNYQGMAYNGEILAWVSDGTLYFGLDQPKVQLKGLSDGEKQLIWMGTDLLIFPDKIAYRVACDEEGNEYPDFEYLDFECGGQADITYYMCEADGFRLNANSFTVGDIAPQAPADGACWVDTSGEKDVLKKYSTSMESWVSVSSTYIHIGPFAAETNPEVGDAVTIQGADIEAVNGTHIVQKVIRGDSLGSWYIVIPGLMREVTHQAEGGGVTLSRTVPDMDFVIECGNRLWGCRYTGGAYGDLNEIYASALGDYRNWHKYEGISTDSYTASRGCPGPWTGAINLSGCPLFFKEDCIERVYPSSSGAHRIVTYNVRGTIANKTLQVLDGLVYYQSPYDVCVFDGSEVTGISDKLWGKHRGTPWSGYAAGTEYGRYFICLRDPDKAEQYDMMVFDPSTGLWACDKVYDRPIVFFASSEAEEMIWCVGNQIYRRQPGTARPMGVWMLQSAVFGYSQPNRKYVSRLQLRLSIQEGGYGDLFIRYDSGREWELVGHITGTDLVHTALVAVRPRRCDHFELKMEGKGEFRLYSLTKQLEEGGDTP